MGTPKSNVAITLPVGFDAARTEGLDNKVLEFENNRTVLKGSFSSEENITLWLSENESFKAELQSVQEKEEESIENTSTNKEINKENKNLTAEDTVKIRESFEFFKNIFARL